ncbi:MAG: hypothetical protein CMJ18_21645 [Phycisphaeraceae bacterium]|nr:hypothetical protein [Phycisphaeraceae bacterium]
MRTTTLLTTVALLLMVGVAPVPAGIFSEFEAPTYTAGLDIIGVDGWGQFPGTDPTGVVTPDAVSGFETVLSGNQSYTVTTTTDIIAKEFDPGTSLDLETISWRWLIEPGGNGFGALYFSSDLAQGFIDGGIQANLDTTGNFDLLGVGGTIVPSQVPVVAGVEYLMEIQIDFSDPGNNFFIAFATDLTHGGPRLQIIDLALAVTNANEASMAANGGLIITASTPTTFDAIEITPEPSTIGLLAMSAMMLGRRRR